VATRDYRIEGLDCAEEMAALRREVGPVVGGAERLTFDLLNGRMIVAAEVDPSLEGRILAAVGRAGLRATPGEASGSRAPWSLWGRRGRAVMTGLSATALATGFLLQAALRGGLTVSLTVEGHAAFPWPSRFAYAVAVVAGAWFVLPKAVQALRRLRPDMNLLMMIAVAGALAIGEWLEAASVSFLFGLALLLESWSVARARRAIRSLMSLRPATAHVVDPISGQSRDLAVADVAEGAIVRVRAGEAVPLDGALLNGLSHLNEAPITGESTPVEKRPGDTVFAGTINGDSAFEFRVLRRAGATTLDRIARLVETAQARRAPSEQWVERFARFYTPAMMGLALGVAALGPLALGWTWGAGLYQGLVILVIACPCALVISTPVSVVAGLTAAAAHGVLIKGGTFLEAPARLNCLAFDKTGTLTRGRPSVRRVIPFNGHTPEELLARAAAVETQSLHPWARAILAEARARGVAPPRAERVLALQGRGAQGVIGDRLYWVGSPRFAAERGVEAEVRAGLARAGEPEARSLVVVGSDRHVCGMIALADEPRPEARRVVEELRRLGLKAVVMLTGDRRATAAEVAAAAGVDDFEAELLPEDKVEALGTWRRRHGPIAMVGDGVNDAPALAAADLAIAMGAAGSDLALETADVALMTDDLERVPWLVRHARRSLTIIAQNVTFALAVKLVFLGLAAVGRATLWMAIAADMGASLLVIANGLRLLRPK